MNKKLIIYLSFIGIIMAFAQVYGFTKHIELLLWLIIFICYALIIASYTNNRRFLHGFLISVLNGIWIGLIHSIFIRTYVANNPEILAQYLKMPHFASIQIMQLVVGPIIGAVTGLIVGLLAYLAGRISDRRNND